MKYRFNSLSKGFTLFELVVVILLIGLTSTVVFFSISSGFIKSEERAFVEGLYSILIRARTKSLTSNKNVDVIIDPESRSIIFDGSEELAIPETIQIDVGLFHFHIDDKPTIRFYPDGSSTGGELSVISDKRQLEEFKIYRLFGIIERKNGKNN